MIPEFDDNGYLPPGIHPATLEEIAARFGVGSEIRQAEMDSIRWLVDIAGRAGITRIILNGSFVTDVLEPNDVDCVLLMGSELAGDPAVDRELAEGLPFIQMKVVGRAGFDYYTKVLYASDRDFVPKGMLEVVS